MGVSSSSMKVEASMKQSASSSKRQEFQESAKREQLLKMLRRKNEKKLGELAGQQKSEFIAKNAFDLSMNMTESCFDSLQDCGYESPSRDHFFTTDTSLDIE